MKSGPIIEATFDGFEIAHDTYMDWSGGFDLTGVEHVATFCIAEKIQGLDSVSFVQLEQNARNARYHGGGTLQGIGLKTLPLLARVDVAVWNSIPKVKGVIEIKTSNVSFSNLQKDIDKVCAVLKDAGSAQWGLVAYYLSLGEGKWKSAKEKIQDRTKNNCCRAREYVRKKGFKLVHRNRPITVYGGWAWGTEILKISRIN